MVFKRSVALLAFATLAVASAATIDVDTDLKHPVVKEVKRGKNGKVSIVLQEGASVHKKHQHVKKHDEKKHKKHDDKKHKKDKKHHEVKKSHEKKHAAKKTHHKKDASDIVTESGEIVRKYEHGEVRIMAKNQPEQKKNKGYFKKPMKHTKHTKQTDGSLSTTPDSADVTLEENESVALNFEGHDVKLTLLANGSLLLEADKDSYVLPAADDVDIDFTGNFELDTATGSAAATDPVVGSNDTLLTTVEKDISGVAKKFTELASKVTGNNFSKGSAPVIFVCAVLGALATVVGVAAVAVGRARDNTASADPQSVLAEETEDLDEDVEAHVTQATEEGDADADDSESLDSSDSDSDDDNDEEGQFTNEASV